MTSVYSGGLMYEYAWEDNGYGIIKLPAAGASNVQEQPEFKKFASALAKFPAPSGNGGFTSTTHALACPTKNGGWLVEETELPVMPVEAKVVSVDDAGLLHDGKR